ncbi:PAS domain S-box protein [Nocardioides sp.]|uniref:PAS domain S-box protein n=1 Tax=Nocardioides sp. TaxID=35761 RepID=UPI002B7F460B|nr:PAS domain S-box protein [Nocardioides sp.]HXH79578.1 PAS domain S-box protein [Nocardioides sp.]
MTGSGTTELNLPAEPMTAGQARRAVRRALEVAGATHLRDVAELVVSELVTNAVVHAGTMVSLRITAEPAALRVEVEDGSVRLPIRRTWTDTAGTGRGLRIVEEHADRWDAQLTNGGKVVWFEIGDLSSPLLLSPTAPLLATGPDRIEVTLLDMPLLMHWAWQEHAATLLREHLLYALERDDHALDDHAAASDALSILDEHLPPPQLPTDPEALMASSVEPVVTAPRVVVRIPAQSVRHFEVLDDLLTRAVAAAESGALLSPPTQPEMAEMRSWLCGEVAGQANFAEPKPWRTSSSARAALDPGTARAHVYHELSESDEAFLVTDDSSIIVAVTPTVVDFLGYSREDELLGQRILTVVPERFHQAHIAGTTLHVTNGRDALLNLWITVPILRADGSEVPVSLHVSSRRLEDDFHVFVAHMDLPGATAPSL